MGKRDTSDEDLTLGCFGVVAMISFYLAFIFVGGGDSGLAGFFVIIGIVVLVFLVVVFKITVDSEGDLKSKELDAQLERDRLNREENELNRRHQRAMARDQQQADSEIASNRNKTDMEIASTEAYATVESAKWQAYGNALAAGARQEVQEGVMRLKAELSDKRREREFEHEKSMAEMKAEHELKLWRERIEADFKYDPDRKQAELEAWELKRAALEGIMNEPDEEKRERLLRAFDREFHGRR